MLVIDTCVLLYEALDPSQVTPNARRALDEAEDNGVLWCSDISLWEVSLLMSKGRLVVPDAAAFLTRLCLPRSVKVHAIDVEIALLSNRLDLHPDPADRLIAATAVHLGATLLTSDRKLLNARNVKTLW